MKIGNILKFTSAPFDKVGVQLRAGFYVAAAALLWSTDEIFRLSMMQSLDARAVVFSEHLLGLFIMAPWVIYRQRWALVRFTIPEWIAVSVIGVGGAALGGVFYTNSIQILGAATPALIQKIQPLFVVGLAAFVLGERQKLNLFPWAFVALGASFLILFPDLNFRFIADTELKHASGILQAVLSMVLWGGSTIAGKFLLRRNSPSVVVFWRWLGAVIFFVFWFALSPSQTDWSTLRSPDVLKVLLYLASVAGVFSMWVYYLGLKNIAASKAAFIELVFPLGTTVIGAVMLKTEIGFIQILGAGLLLISILQLVIRKNYSQN